MIIREGEVSPRTIKRAIKKFHKDLLRNQKPLPPEFQKIIDDNFWDLLIKEEDIIKGEKN